MKWCLEVNRVETYNRKKKNDSYQIGECQHEQIQKFIQWEGVRLGVPGNDSVCQGSGVDCSDVCVFEWGLG